MKYRLLKPFLHYPVGHLFKEDDSRIAYDFKVGEFFQVVHLYPHDIQTWLDSGRLEELQEECTYHGLKKEVKESDEYLCPHICSTPEAKHKKDDCQYFHQAEGVKQCKRCPDGKCWCTKADKEAVKDATNCQGCQDNIYHDHLDMPNVRTIDRLPKDVKEDSIDICPICHKKMMVGGKGATHYYYCDEHGPQSPELNTTELNTPEHDDAIVKSTPDRLPDVGTTMEEKIIRGDFRDPKHNPSTCRCPQGCGKPKEEKQTFDAQNLEVDYVSTCGHFSPIQFCYGTTNELRIHCKDCPSC